MAHGCKTGLHLYHTTCLCNVPLDNNFKKIVHKCQSHVSRHASTSLTHFVLWWLHYSFCFIPQKFHKHDLDSALTLRALTTPWYCEIEVAELHCFIHPSSRHLYALVPNIHSCVNYITIVILVSHGLQGDAAWAYQPPVHFQYLAAAKGPHTLFSIIISSVWLGWCLIQNDIQCQPTQQ
jgi:hypothetical protein